MRQRISAALKAAANDRAAFVIINVAVNLLLLVRSFITLKVLDYRALGLVALVQGIVLLIGALQFGVLNGGFRLLCASEDGDEVRINNLVYTFLVLLSLVAAAVTAAVLVYVPGSEFDAVALCGVVGGIATLGRTWTTNQLVAWVKLKAINRTNLISGFASLAALVLIPFDPLLACLLSIVAQPVVFVLGALASDRRLLPTGFETSGALLRAVLNAGFIVFLTGIFLQLNLQVERWYITVFLGVEQLGHLSLALLFIAIFQLVPTSFDQLFLPPAVRAHSAGDAQGLRKGIHQFFLVQLGYCALAALCVAALAQPVTAWLLPKYVADLRYVYIVLPGLILFTLSGPFALPFNVLIRYRYYFIAYGGGTGVTALVFLYAMARGGTLGLDGAMVVRSAVYALMAGVILFGFLAVTRDLRGMRFNPLRRVRGGEA